MRWSSLQTGLLRSRPSVGMAIAEVITVSAAREIDPRPVQPSAVAAEADTRATNILPEEQKGHSTLYVSRVCEKREMR